MLLLNRVVRTGWAHPRPARAVLPHSQLLKHESRCNSTVTAALKGHPVVYHPDFQISPIPDTHRFPMPKDALLYKRLQEVGMAGSTFEPAYPDAETLQLVHTPEYVEGFLNGTLSAEKMRQIGLPWSEKLVNRTLIGTGSAILAARLALQYGVACMTNGGTHHAYADHGSGWSM